MNINVHTTIIVENTSFCTLTSHVWQCKVSTSFALSYHGIYSQPEDYDDRSGTWGDNEPDMTVWLFASVSFADFVCVRPIGESTYLSLHCKSLRFFPFTFPSLKQKVVETINSYNVMTVFVVRSHFHHCKELWSWHNFFFFTFTILLLYIDILSLLRTTIIPVITSVLQGTNKLKLSFQDNFQVIMSLSIFAAYSGWCQCDGRRRTDIEMVVTGLVGIE